MWLCCCFVGPLLLLYCVVFFCIVLLVGIYSQIGYVGEIVASINYSALMSSQPADSPVRISVSEVYVVVGPKQMGQFDEEKYVKEMIQVRVRVCVCV